MADRDKRGNQPKQTLERAVSGSGSKDREPPTPRGIAGFSRAIAKS
jgi:hypothetical protein